MTRPVHLLVPLILAALCSTDGGAQSLPPASRRVALVIGNSAYGGGRSLKNPRNDARSLARRLSELGFDVTLKVDSTQEEMDNALSEFGQRLGPESAAVFFFAGHGIQVDGVNYLLPTDFDRRGTEEQRIKSSSIPADEILERMEKSRSRLNLLILDACRDNPFVSRRSRSAAGGLAEMKAAQGTAVMFATDAGKTADDNPGDQNGIFTKFLLETLDEPGLSVGEIQERVADKVMKATNNTQNPAYTTKIAGRFVLNKAQKKPDASLAANLVAESPVFTSLTADKSEASPAQPVNLSATATDPGADPLYYQWSATRGTIDASGPKAIFLLDTPQTGGNTEPVRITVTARNSRGLQANHEIILQVRKIPDPPPGGLVGLVRSLGSFLDVQLESDSPGPAATSGSILVRLHRVDRVWQIVDVNGSLPGSPVLITTITSDCKRCPVRVAEFPTAASAFLRCRIQVQPEPSQKALSLAITWESPQSKKKGSK